MRDLWKWKWSAAGDCRQDLNWRAPRSGGGAAAGTSGWASGACATGGDLFTGPALLVDAVGAGRRATRSIHQFLRGEEVKAYLLLEPEKTRAEVPPESVLAHCAENLARFKIPRYLEYCGEFPRTPSLKIKKSSLLAAKADLREDSFDRVDGVWR